MRRATVTVLALLAVLGTLVVSDFFQVGRQPPRLVSSEQRATRILVEKHARRLTLFHGGQPIKTYRVSLGHDPSGPKQREGDNRTPEGRYTIDSKNGHSHFHLALHVSYPNAEDQARAAHDGVSPGADIMIHGLPNGLGWLGGLHLLRDWTDGCVAVSNSEIEEIWALTDVGTQVEIKP